jgi:tetratricopeptide (TPR) repeat protein/uncharacterized protein YegL
MPVKLSHQLVLSYVSIMAVASLVGGLMTILLEQPHVRETVDIMTETMTESELGSLTVRLDVLLATSAALFSQFIGDVNYQFAFATSVFDDSLPISSFYPNYDVRDHSSNPPPNVGANGISTEYSSWYKNTNTSTLPYLNRSSVLDNSHGALLKSNPSIAGLYMGFEDGMMRNYPYQNVETSYQTMSYECVHSQQTVVGYDPRCRGWYHAALINQSDVVFTTPYNDASTGLVMITLARAVMVDSFMVGAVGADITLESLEATVLSATVMENGYSYLCDGKKQLIVHPDLDYSTDSNVYRVTDKEFDPQAENEVIFFENLLDDRVLKGEVGQQAFSKSGQKWYVSYGPVNGTSYFLLMVVPESDITKSADTLEEDANTAITILIVVVVLVLCFIIVVGTWFAMRTSRKITEPVEVFNRILNDIAENEYVLAQEQQAHEYGDIINLQHKINNLFLAVKFSTESYFKGDYNEAIECLQEVEEMFRVIDQKRALGVVYNNKGNILRRAKGKDDGFISALKSLKASVDNIAEFVKITESKLDATTSTADNEEMRDKQSEFLTLFRGILASRLSNYGDCLREAGRHEDALEVLSTSYELNSGVDNLMGMIQALGNKGLVWVDLKNFHEAQQCFTSAMEMSDNQFAVQKDEKTLASVQQASLNLGLFYYAHAKETLLESNNYLASDHHVRLDDNSQRLVEMALNRLYITLLIADRIAVHVKRTCVVSLREIYAKYYGDVGSVACDKLNLMFPDVASGGSNSLNINFLIDVSPSMSGRRIKSCEKTLVNIVNNKMKNGDVLAVNVFAKEYNTLIPVTQLSNSSRGGVIGALQTLPFLTNKGATYFYSALSRMATELAAENGTSNVQWIVALTDGEDNERRTTFESAKKTCTENNINVIMISVGLESPRVLGILKYLASEEKYFLKATDDPAAITGALSTGFDLAASGNIMMESL